MSRKWYIGEQRADIGRAKAAYFVGSCMADPKGYDPSQLLPNPPDETEQDDLATMEAIARQLEAQWPHQSEP